MKLYVSSFFISGKCVVAKPVSRINKYLAAKAIANYLNVNSMCSWHTYYINEVRESLILFDIPSYELTNYIVVYY